MHIDPNAGVIGDGYSPPPIDQNYTEERAIVTHEIPGRDGDRTQDQGRLLAGLTLTGICFQDVADMLVGMNRTGNGGGYYTIVYADDAGGGTSYPPMWIRKCSVGPRKGTSKWRVFSVTFIEKKV